MSISRVAADEGPADKRDPFILVYDVTQASRAVCKIPAENVEILR